MYGLDELPEELQEQPFIFFDLMHGRLLPKATILVTTRPWASQYLHLHGSHRIDQHVAYEGIQQLVSTLRLLASCNQYQNCM